MKNSFMKALLTAGVLSAASLAPALTSPALAEADNSVEQFISLNRSIVVEEEFVRLGDIFSGLEDQADTPIGRAPKAGTTVQLEARWLATLARNYGVDWSPSSRLEYAEVKRDSIRLERSELLDMVKMAFQTRGEQADLEISLEEPQDSLHIPRVADAKAGIVGLERNADSNRFRARLVYPDNGSPLVRMELSGRAYEMVEVPVVNKRVNRSDIITESDIAWESQRLDRLHADTVTDAERMFGKSPRRTLRAGSSLRGNDLVEPILVTKNSGVTIRYRNANMHLTVSGRALEEGTDGAVIRVMNTKSNQVIEAVVEDTGLVSVGGHNTAMLN
ncbi:flagellar basal body P-ring formation chaperone FlgA [Fodinicurvata sediminis]|uniref:flagellar basal body P-ring formation chaperone FlgA n=1 Tax=Fodinicurvata sediminis TaxID=1121832 RepID=UPI0003B64F97|nr:flagellar basal body P-ring formation chaperone FlgA [Fodinicurvata sediminis]